MNESIERINEIMNFYFLLKTLHILSSVVLVGTGFGSAFYLLMLNRIKNIEVIRAINQKVVLADYLFTIPSLILQPLTGWALMKTLNLSWGTLWIEYTLLLYLFAGLCWLPAYFLQIKLMKLSEAANDYEALGLTYKKYLQFWAALGFPSFLAMLGIYYLMVSKPY